ncbi:MAG: hypothetical protein CM1200mP2_13950 [Planctomycetaceae bacterium]|nr:MAG: hypothetical protein CM1200mP2_13950 [Planctomycetaceae bacterium]
MIDELTEDRAQNRSVDCCGSQTATTTSVSRAGIPLVSPTRPPRANPRRPSSGESTPSRREPFERFDRNRDGKLTPEEFPEQARPRITSYLKQLGKDGLSPRRFRRDVSPATGQPRTRESREAR